MQNCVLIVVTSTLSELLFEAEVDASGVVDKNPLQHLLDVFEGGGQIQRFFDAAVSRGGDSGCPPLFIKGVSEGVLPFGLNHSNLTFLPPATM